MSNKAEFIKQYNRSALADENPNNIKVQRGRTSDLRAIHCVNNNYTVCLERIFELMHESII